MRKNFSEIIFRDIKNIHSNTGFSFTEKSDRLFALLNKIFLEVTKNENLHFTTLFSRIAYVCNKHNVPKKTQYLLHRFRKLSLNKERNGIEEEKLYLFGVDAMSKITENLFKQTIPDFIKEIVPEKIIIAEKEVEIKQFRKTARVVIINDDPQNDRLTAIDEEDPTKEIFVQYNIAERNINFNPTILEIRNTFDFPLTVSLIDVEIDREGVYRPAAFVVEPDFLVDVSAIAECFQSTGAEPYLHLLKKFLPFEATKYLMIGNIANYFLDELMHNSDAIFDEIFPNVFKLNPLAFSLFDNEVIKEIWRISRKHFLNLKIIVKKGLYNQNIKPEDCFLEPSFYSNIYGLQGRLDVFYPAGNASAIIELKSGKLFRPNAYKINVNHYTQTLLYDLLIKSVFENKFNPVNYILYSGIDDKNLKFAPALKVQQYEALQLRNKLIAIEKRLADFSLSENDDIDDLQKLNPIKFTELSGFQRRDVVDFYTSYSNLTVLEKKYFNAFTGFVAREFKLAKTGEQGVENINGLASLWLSSFSEKEENFEIFSFLKIISNNVDKDEPVIVFAKTEKTNPLANFRVGDIAVLYPVDGSDIPVLRNQIFKCNIVKISEKEVGVNLRFKQFNISIFEKYEYWNLEHDKLDGGFTSMYRGLFAFTNHTKKKRDLLLSLFPPEKPQETEIIPPEDLTTEQQDVFSNILKSKDYYLLWGPPGTGKTSKMLKSIADWIFRNTDENILLLAYTNRAVDEICEALDENFDKLRNENSGTNIPEYIRIGSPFSTPGKFQNRLLAKIIKPVKTRKELIKIITKHRFFVGTIASVVNKHELFRLKKFQRVIIDEASQVLEPQLIGFLPHFDKFVLIGDHKQLPAVVVQDNKQSVIEDEELNAIGLNNMRNSLFERLYKRCVDNDWNWAYGKLSHQGRMHKEIMAFSNRYFYGGFLKILPDSIAYFEKQERILDYKLPHEPTETEKHIALHRITFFPTPIDDFDINNKTNVFEAEKIAELVKAFTNIFKENNIKITNRTIGIITPYRAQIATISDVLQKQNIDMSLLTIDTVERYQGGARDVILISLCTNDTGQFKNLVSLSDSGVDRKLNVAVTRAKEHLAIVGNEEILRKNELYEKLLNSAYKYNGVV